MNDNRRILVSLVNWYRYEDTIRCARQIQQLYAVDISIVDNDSPNDSYAQLAKHLSDMNIIASKENRGYAGGHKLNIEYAMQHQYDAVWILNSDIDLVQNTLDAIIAAWQMHGDNVYGSVTLNSENTHEVEFGGCPIEESKENADRFIYDIYKGCIYNEIPNDEVWEVPCVEGSSCFIPMNVILKYGFMRTDYFMYAEELDYCYSLRKKNNVKCYIVRNSVVVHKNSSSFKLPQDIGWIMNYYRRRNFIYFMRDYYAWNRLTALKQYYSVSSQLKFIIKYYINREFRSYNKANYALLKACYHSVFNIKGRTINPNNYVKE